MTSLPGRLALVALLAIASGLAGCDARLREIRSSLSDDERALFDRGAALSSPCWACHDFYGTQDKIGPHLSGVFGRRAGNGTFRGYSGAMRSSQLVWDARTLDAFLAGPARLVPGTTMVSPGVPDPRDREALIFYMREVTAAP